MEIHKICRVCLEEGALTSIYSTEFAMMPCVMMMMCAKIRVYKTDGLPAAICNNCIYRLGVAYHFKQECENSDMRLRQYLGLLDKNYGFCDAETNTENAAIQQIGPQKEDINTDEHEKSSNTGKRCKRRSRYQRKPPEQHKKRGPKPLLKLPQTCYECNKTFKCQAQLQMHTRTHTGEKPFACHYCSRRFAQKYNLQIHERIHSGERPYQCEICSKQFSALGNFQVHQKIHTGVRDQICHVCQKSFYSAGDLSKHMMTHTELKSNQCDICCKTFSRQRDMQAHKRKLHQGLLDRRTEDNKDVPRNSIVATHATVINSERFKCSDCGKIFPSTSSLSVHCRTHGNSSSLNPPLVGEISSSHSSQSPRHYNENALCVPPSSSTVISRIRQPNENVHSVHHLSLNIGHFPPPTQANHLETIPPTIMRYMLPPAATHSTYNPPHSPSVTKQCTITMMSTTPRVQPY